MRSRLLAFLIGLVLFAGGCATPVSKPPLTPRLARHLFVTPEDFNKMPVIYQGYMLSATGSAVFRHTRFRFADEQTSQALTLGGIPTYTETTTTRHDDIMLPNGTPGIVTTAVMTPRGFYRLTVDFGGAVLEFESRNPYKQFELISERIVVDGKTYERELGSFGRLSIEAYEFKNTTTHETVRFIQGRQAE